MYGNEYINFTRYRIGIGQMAQLVVLLLVFLSAILLHYFLLREGFQGSMVDNANLYIDGYYLPKLKILKEYLKKKDDMEIASTIKSIESIEADVSSIRSDSSWNVRKEEEKERIVNERIPGVNSIIAKYSVQMSPLVEFKYNTSIPSPIDNQKPSMDTSSSPLQQTEQQLPENKTDEPVQQKPQTSVEFSELVGALLTYTPKQHTLENSASVEDIRKVVRSEIEAELASKPQTKKDVVNEKIACRTTSPLEATEAPKAAPTYSETEGRWFRNAGGECPYARRGNASLVKPIDMSEYIRKDSIPCWACNIK
jgi:hypothetical protein